MAPDTRSINDKQPPVAHSRGPIPGFEHVAKRPETVAANIGGSAMGGHDFEREFHENLQI